MGFGVPIDSWLRKDLKNWGSHLLSDGVFKKHQLLKKDDIQLMWSNSIKVMNKIGSTLFGMF